MCIRTEVDLWLLELDECVPEPYSFELDDGEECPLTGGIELLINDLSFTIQQFLRIDFACVTLV